MSEREKEWERNERKRNRARERENIEKLYITLEERATTGKIEPPLAEAMMIADGWQWVNKGKKG